MMQPKRQMPHPIAMPLRKNGALWFIRLNYFVSVIVPNNPFA
jgi:hypothetical protein